MKKILERILVVAGAVILVLVIKNVFLKKNKPSLAPTSNQTGLKPTISAEERKIVSNIQTYTVEIKPTEVFPNPIEVKIFDQVIFKNISGKTINIVGKNWGNIPIEPEGTMLQPFNTAGNFSYEVQGLDTPIKGLVIVK